MSYPPPPYGPPAGQQQPPMYNYDPNQPPMYQPPNPNMMYQHHQPMQGHWQAPQYAYSQPPTINIYYTMASRSNSSVNSGGSRRGGVLIASEMANHDEKPKTAAPPPKMESHTVIDGRDRNQPIDPYEMSGGLGSPAIPCGSGGLDDTVTADYAPAVRPQRELYEENPMLLNDPSDNPSDYHFRQKSDSKSDQYSDNHSESDRHPEILVCGHRAVSQPPRLAGQSQGGLAACLNCRYTQRTEVDAPASESEQQCLESEIRRLQSRLSAVKIYNSALREQNEKDLYMLITIDYMQEDYDEEQRRLPAHSRVHRNMYREHQHQTEFFEASLKKRQEKVRADNEEHNDIGVPRP